MQVIFAHQPQSHTRFSPAVRCDVGLAYILPHSVLQSPPAAMVIRSVARVPIALVRYIS